METDLVIRMSRFKTRYTTRFNLMPSDSTGLAAKRTNVTEFYRVFVLFFVWFVFFGQHRRGEAGGRFQRIGTAACDALDAALPVEADVIDVRSFGQVGRPIGAAQLSLARRRQPK